jgi:glucans biosynthesis protein
MTLRPGDATIVDVEATLCPRTALEHVGIAGMTGRRRRRGGRSARTGRRRSCRRFRRVPAPCAGTTIWRPVQNPETLQISAFMDQDPKGFGLVQRARAYGQ